jgi:hypothetical protein
LRFNFVVAAHLQVRFTPQFLRALQLELFTKPSEFSRKKRQMGLEPSLIYPVQIFCQGKNGFVKSLAMPLAALWPEVFRALAGGFSETIVPGTHDEVIRKGMETYRGRTFRIPGSGVFISGRVNFRCKRLPEIGLP